MTDTHPLTLEQAARRLGVATRTMQRYVDAYDKQGDRSKGFDAVKVATQRGRGYVWRFRFDTDAPDATPVDAVVDASRDASGATVVRALVDASGSQGGALHMVLVALGEARRESGDLAYRLGVSETERQRLKAERDQLRAEVEALRHQAAPPPSSAAPTPSAATATPDAPAPAGGLWARLRRVFGGE